MVAHAVGVFRDERVLCQRERQREHELRDEHESTPVALIPLNARPSKPRKGRKQSEKEGRRDVRGFGLVNLHLASRDGRFLHGMGQSIDPCFMSRHQAASGCSLRAVRGAFFERMSAR